MQRVEISKLILKEDTNILGRCTSVEGEYYIPELGKTGFYKSNGCMCGAMDDADLRELLAARIMEKIGFPHADIILAVNEDGQNGCLSVNILNENEKFVEPSNKRIQYRDINNGEDFINFDLELISSIPGINAEDLRIRKEYLLRYLLISAFISNTDIKFDNMMLIKNISTENYRNPEYYDMGIAFIENNNRRFFLNCSSIELIEQLYNDYPSQIVPLGRKIEQNINRKFIKSLLDEESFNGFSLQNKKSIIRQLINRMECIKRLNSRPENNFTYSTDEVHKVCKDVPNGVKEQLGALFNRIFRNNRGRN